MCLLIINADIPGDSRDALLIENGRIKKIGYSREFEKIQGKFLDFNRHWLLPGFIDSHVHLLQTGLANKEIDLAGANSVAEILALLSANLKDKNHLIARNLAPYKLKEQRYPVREELDKVSFETPISIRREDFHSGVFNTKALEMLQLESETGILTGKKYEIAVQRMAKLTTKQEMIEAYIDVSSTAIQKGVTTISGLFTNFREYEIFLEIKDKLQVTVIPFIQTLEIEKVKELGLPRIGGCLLIDGSVGSGTAALFENYRDDSTNKGTLYFDTSVLEYFVSNASTQGLQIAMHAIGDRAINQLLQAYKKANSNRHRLEHGELIKDEELEISAQNGIIVSAQPSYESYFNEVYEHKLGRKRAFEMNPFRKIIDSGIHLAFGSDSPITPIDPLNGIQSALNHPNPESRINLAEAINCFTYEGAYANFIEDRVGCIKEGFNADIVGVSNDLKRITFVMKEGNLCYKNL